MNEPQLGFGTPARPNRGRRNLPAVAWAAMAAMQTFILVASLLLPAAVLANDPTAEPTPPATEQPSDPGTPADPTATPTEAPILVAPASNIARASSIPLTPPDALTPRLCPTVLLINETSSTVAPPFAKPVEVLTKSAPAFFEARHARTFSSSVSSAVSMMTLSNIPFSCAASATARMSSSTAQSSPDFKAPILMTISTSRAPLKIARRAS